MMFIYALIDPITLHVMYIGKTKDVPNRFRAHTSLAINRRYKGVKGDWIRYLAWHGLKPHIEVLKEVREEDAQLWEYFYTRLFQICPLVNTGLIFKETYQMTIW